MHMPRTRDLGQARVPVQLTRQWPFLFRYESR